MNRIFYVSFTEFSRNSGGNFPHVEMHNVNYEEAVSILNYSLEYPFAQKNIGNSWRSMPKSILPLIITNDSKLAFTYRHAFTHHEFEKWCLSEIDEELDREYYINSNHSNKLSLRDCGKEILLKFQSIIDNKIESASMSKGVSEDSYTDEFGQTFYSTPSIYDEGWEVEKTKKEIAYNKNYSKWDILPFQWKQLLIHRTHIITPLQYYEDINSNYRLNILKKGIVPSDFELEKFFSIENISIAGVSKNTIDLTFLKNFEKLKKLDLSFQSGLVNFNELKFLKNLEVLNLSHTNVSDLSFISELKKIKSLNLSSTNIKNFESLYSLKKLEILDISYGKINFLAPLPNLKELDITHLKIDGVEIDFQIANKYYKLLGYKLDKFDY